MPKGTARVRLWYAMKGTNMLKIEPIILQDANDRFKEPDFCLHGWVDQLLAYPIVHQHKNIVQWYAQTYNHSIDIIAVPGWLEYDPRVPGAFAQPYPTRFYAVEDRTARVINSYDPWNHIPTLGEMNEYVQRSAENPMYASTILDRVVVGGQGYYIKGYVNQSQHPDEFGDFEVFPDECDELGDPILHYWEGRPTTERLAADICEHQAV